MGNVLRILKRDVLRLLKAPAAIIVVGALLVLPSLYTWYNVVAFWNPYEATGNLKVCVVNQDAGASNKLAGEIDVGARVTEELLANDKLAFVSEGYDKAMADLEAGNVYAVYVIPKDFSECLISPLSGTLKTPTIEYYANEKLGPVSPKITDTAATTLEESINSMFVQTVSDAVVQAMDDALESGAGKAEQARSVATVRMSAAMGALSQVSDDLTGARTATDDAKSKVDAVVESMNNVSATIGDARTLVGDIAIEADAVEARLLNMAADAANALPGAISKAAQIEAKADGIVDDIALLTSTSRDRASAAASHLESAASALGDLSTRLEDIANSLPDSWLTSGSALGGLTTDRSGWLTTVSLEPSAADSEAGMRTSAEGDTGASGLNASVKSRLLEVSREIGDKAGQLRTLAEKAKGLDGQLADLSKTASDTASGLKESATRVADALQAYADGLYGATVNTITSTLTRVKSACTRVTAALSGLDATVAQAQSGMRQLAGLLGDCSKALSQTDVLVGDIQNDLGSLTSDIRLLADSSALAELLGSTDLNSENISAFLGAPTKVEKVAFYHPNAYGAAMAPLFMNLTFWIGAFMLVIIFRLEVDDEGLKRVTLWQRYLSRLLLFSVFAAAQAIICCAGVLALGVEVASVPALFFGSAFASLAYLSIIYALSANLQHIGKALCIILVFAQIPGGSGLYPLELTDGFFQAIYPFLPFSYGIGVLREAIFGFYGDYFLVGMVVLAAIFIGMMVLGMAAVPFLSNVTRMAARQIREGGLYNGEEAVVPARPYRLSQVVSALSDRDDYRENLARRYTRFLRLYPVFIRVSIVLGIGVPVALMLCMALNAGEKVVLLTVFLLFFIGLIVFLLVVESLRYSFERQLNIERMSDGRLMKLFFDRDRMKPALAHVTSGEVEPSGNAGGEAETPGNAGGQAGELDGAEQEAHDA